MNKLADDLERLCCAETEGKFFDLVTDNIGEIIAALREVSTLRAQVAADIASLNRQAQILKANDERWEQVHDMVQQARELVRLHIVYDARPPGLFQKLQDALHAIRGRAALTRV